MTDSASATGLDAAPPETDIPAEFPFEKTYVDVLGSKMACVDFGGSGEGETVVFLHGNPTSSYLWRNIIPSAGDNRRVIAPDLIGMGDSDKPDIGYTFAEHAAYLDALFERLGLQDVILVVHDWGSALGMRYARLNPDKVRALAFMEAIIPPALPAESYEAMGPGSGELFKTLRTPQVGEEMVLNHNFFVEEVLAKRGIVRDLGETELAEYRRPFETPDSRLPTLVWPRQIPIGGEPADVVREVSANGEWLYSTPIPKLFFHATPGALNPAPLVEYVKANASNLTVVTLGVGAHYIQEDHPRAIGEALSDWLDTLQEFA
ncbi:MAG: haloalkane dehalogenase [Pseudomonadota bacterium]